MSDIEYQKKLHSGAYVQMYEEKPISRIARLVPRLRLRGDEELADFACGNAMLLPLVHKSIAHYHGVDFSEDFIEAAKQRAAKHSVINCTFYCEDIVGFCDAHVGRFDIATAFDFSEHVDDSDFLRIFGAIRRSLKPGGRLFLHTPNLEFFIERLKDKGVIRQFPEHIAVRTAEDNVALLEQSGFASSDIAVDGLAHYESLRIVHPLRRLPVVGRMFIARLFIECKR
jgi:2-polyprenyl-3-methyl-5-hydroxy-6-metoxy-1,4-benzoquinol methylase